MTHVSPSPADPKSSSAIDPELLRALEVPLAKARARAGDGRIALILGGSFASGEAVWADVDGQRVALSDLDIYAIFSTRQACRDAAMRGEDPEARQAGEPRLEMAFLTVEDLARQPARPGILELQRHGIVVDGDPAVRNAIPPWTARDVRPEEIGLLLENRAFELILAYQMFAPHHPELGVRPNLVPQHLTHKVTLDLATVECLAAGEYPDGIGARVARARELRGNRAPEPPWDEALAFRARPRVLWRELSRDLWMRVARAWEASWRRHVAGGTEDEAPEVTALRAARRAPLRRRYREALTFRPRTAGGPNLGELLRLAPLGTPQHRLNAMAALIVMRSSRPEKSDWWPPFPKSTFRALVALGMDDQSLKTPWISLIGMWSRWITHSRRDEGVLS